MIKSALAGKRDINMDDISRIAQGVRRSQDDSRGQESLLDDAKIKTKQLLNRTLESKNTDSLGGTEYLSKQFDKMQDMTMSRLKAENFGTEPKSSFFTTSHENQRNPFKSGAQGDPARSRLREVDEKINEIFARDFSNER